MKKILISLSFVLLITLLILTINVLIFIKQSVEEIDTFDLTKLNKTESIFIYDKEDTLIMDLSLKKQDYVSIDEISDNMIHALISVEDKRFYEHNGIDYKRLIKAVLNNFKDQKYSEGASTINQQLVKNMFLSTEKTLKRKVQELYLSMSLGNYLTKDQILEYYLNSVLFGKCFYGIKRASEFYFKKLPKDLTIEEAAMLAGIVQLPNFYDPYKNLEETKNRRDTVLYLMFQNNYLTEEDYQRAISSNIVLNENPEVFFENFKIHPMYSSYYDIVLEELMENYQLDIHGHELKIYTNLNMQVQKTIYDIMQNEYKLFKNADMQAGIAFINNKTRTLEAVGGTRSNDLNVINYATTKNQPASAIKPLLVYGNLFEQFEFSPAELVNDEKIVYDNGQILNNWDMIFKGYITWRQALKESRNIPSLKAYRMINKEIAYQNLAAMNLKSIDPPYEAHAMGGFSDGFSAVQMANAYMTFANKGKFTKSNVIEKIICDEQTYTYKQEETRIFSEETVFLIDDILKQVLQYTSFDLPEMNLKSKTGQSNFPAKVIDLYGIPANSTKDSWIIGYNDFYTVAVWTGFSKFGEQNYFMGNDIHLCKKMYKVILENHGIRYRENIQIPDALLLKDYFILEDKIYSNENKFSNVYHMDYFFKNKVPGVLALD